MEAYYKIGNMFHQVGKVEITLYKNETAQMKKKIF